MRIMLHNRVLVSACLLGVHCRYDGGSNWLPQIMEWVAQGYVLPVCPEAAGGLPTPRLPAEIEGADLGLDGNDVLDGRTRVLCSDGVDVTAQYVEGAEVALIRARELDICQALLKADSPSCGAGRIHGGKFNGNLVTGDGVTAALLKRAGLEVLTEADILSRCGGRK